MKNSVSIIAAVVVLILFGCGREDYHAHETEAFNHEKMATFKKLTNMRSSLKSALWNAGDEKNRQNECRLRLTRALAAVSDADEIDRNFTFVCKTMECEWGECRIHTIQSLIVSSACVSCQMINTSSMMVTTYNAPVTEKHREAIEKAIADIDNAIAVLETPEEFIETLKK